LSGRRAKKPIYDGSQKNELNGYATEPERMKLSGKILGLSSFDLLGHKYDPTWVKGGVGVEGKLGIGKISLMLNGTTEGEMPSAWFLTSYQIVF
jgi:hypothetical protein